MKIRLYLDADAMDADVVMACSRILGEWAKTLVKAKDEGKKMTFHVVLEQAEDGWIVAECPALPGCVSQGRDAQEAIVNIKEAITAWLWAEDQKALAALPAPQSVAAVLVTL